MAVSEAVYICEREWIDAVVIAPDVEYAAALTLRVNRWLQHHHFLLATV